MTEAVSLKPDLGRYGVWLATRSITPELAAQIESLGYGAAWIGGSPDADLAWVEPALAQTTSLQLATGIVNIWSAPAAAVAESYQRIENAYPGRFLLGIGVGHPEHTQEYVKPYDALVGYLDELDAAVVPTSRRVLAALGPRVLRLSAERSAGAHPYLTTPEHTAQGARTGRQLGVPGARAQGGAHHRRRRGPRDRPRDRRPLSGPEQLREQLAAAGVHRRRRAQARQRQADRRGGGLRHPRGRSRKRLNEHLEAGADHVAIQVLGGCDEEHAVGRAERTGRAARADSSELTAPLG